ncbi:MAG: flagellar biosynthesis protein FliR [Kiritimatiellia bacterium]|jgi:flagellar biosynthesis protein FliR
MVFLMSGPHLRTNILISERFHHLPPSTMIDIKPAAHAFIDAVEVPLLVGFQLSGPLIALVSLVNLFIGILSRLAPKMNV